MPPPTVREATPEPGPESDDPAGNQAAHQSISNGFHSFQTALLLDSNDQSQPDDTPPRSRQLNRTRTGVQSSLPSIRSILVALEQLATKGPVGIGRGAQKRFSKLPWPSRRTLAARRRRHVRPVKRARFIGFLGGWHTNTNTWDTHHTNSYHTWSHPSPKSPKSPMSYSHMIRLCRKDPNWCKKNHPGIAEWHEKHYGKVCFAGN